MSDTARDFYVRHHEGSTGFRRYGFTFGDRGRIDWFRSKVGVGGRVLDIGCRDGTLTAEFVEGNRVTGVDIDDVALGLARERLGIDTVHSNLNVSRLPFEDGSFDVVVMGEVLEHLQFPDVVVDEVHRVLRSGGRFVGSVPNAFRLKNRLTFLLGREFETDPTHLHQFSPSGLARCLGRFATVELGFLGGRYRRLSPELFGSDIVFCARRGP